MDEMKPIIELIQTNMRMEQEGAVMRAVAYVGVNVDKERLVRAIEDARSFWMEGYNEGVNAGRPHGRWVQYDGDSWKCSECGEENCWAYTVIKTVPGVVVQTDRYCPNCGAKMDLEEEDDG